MADKQKILLIKTGAFGDVVLTSFSINAAVEIYPEANIYFLTSEQYAEIHQDCELLKKILILPSRRNIFHFISFTGKIRRIKFQKIFDLQGNLKTNFYTLVFGGKERIGLYKRFFGKLFLTNPIKKNLKVNPVEFQKLFWKKVSDTQIRGNLQLWISEEKRKKILDLFETYKLLPGSYVVFHMSASTEWETKKWIPEYWASLVEFFSQKKFSVVLVGDKNSVSTNEKIGKLIKGKLIDLTGKTSFFELAFIIQHARLCITTDSGPMHVASAVDTETIAIFGPTDPFRHAADGIKTIKSDIDCSPCYKKKCSHHSCMKLITPEKILGLIKIEKQ